MFYVEHLPPGTLALGLHRQQRVRMPMLAVRIQLAQIPTHWPLWLSPVTTIGGDELGARREGVIVIVGLDLLWGLLARCSRWSAQSSISCVFLPCLIDANSRLVFRYVIRFEGLIISAQTLKLTHATQKCCDLLWVCIV